MKATGVVVEYNPFHNGHKYHLEMARKHGQGDIVIAAMSGDFLQRGEPAIINKWKRTEMVLKNGVDIVVELPTFYSTQSAEIFAKGSVEILGALGVSDIVFGSESGDVEKLEEIARLEEDEVFQEGLREELARGVSYPTAFSKTLEKILGKKGYFSPNDILGTEYVRAIRKKNLKVEPIAIKREGTGYHSHDVAGKIASATAIRKMLAEGSEGIREVLPEVSYEILTEEHREGRTAFLRDYYPLIRHEIILHRDLLDDIQDVEVGFQNKLYSAAVKYEGYDEFYDEIMSKRYTNARLQRILIHILLGLTVKHTVKAKEGVPYIRILGFNERGHKYLKGIKKNQEIPTFTTLKNVSKKLDEDAKALLDFNERASKIYGIVKKYEQRSIPIMLRGEEQDG